MNAKHHTFLFAFRPQSLKNNGETLMIFSVSRIIASVAIVVIAFACSFHTTPVDARADRGISNNVSITVNDVHGNFCHTITYNYLTPDTTTQHYRFYHRGPRVADTHDDNHFTVITKVNNWKGVWDLDTLCDGTDPNDPYYLCDGTDPNDGYYMVTG
jgi:hypothetical protein